MNDRAFNQYIATLLYTIKTATETAKLIKGIRNQTIKISEPRAKSMILERLVEYAILKAWCLFDYREKGYGLL